MEKIHLNKANIYTTFTKINPSIKYPIKKLAEDRIKNSEEILNPVNLEIEQFLRKQTYYARLTEKLKFNINLYVPCYKNLIRKHKQTKHKRGSL